MEQNNLTVREIINLNGIPNMKGTVVMFDYTYTITDTTSIINNATNNNTKTFFVIGMIEKYDEYSLYMRATIIYDSIYSFNCNNFGKFNVDTFPLDNISNFKVADENDIERYMESFKMHITELSKKTDNFIKNHSAIQQIMDIINDGNIDKNYVIEYLKS